MRARHYDVDRVRLFDLTSSYEGPVHFRRNRSDASRNRKQAEMQKQLKERICRMKDRKVVQKIREWLFAEAHKARIDGETFIAKDEAHLVEMLAEAISRGEYEKVSIE